LRAKRVVLTDYDHKPRTNITAKTGSDNTRYNIAQIHRRKSGHTIVAATNAHSGSLDIKKSLVFSVIDVPPEWVQG
jgi:hypothetical protein